MGWAIVLCIAIVAVQSTPAAAQREVSIAVSGFEADGGFVNFVEGNGRCLCAKPVNEHGKQPLSNGDTIELEDGRAEIVLIPGYYVRFAEHTTARLLDLTADNLKIEILKGSAVVEMLIEPELGFALSARVQETMSRLFNVVDVITPSGEYAVLKSGAYRFDVAANGASSVRVLKGSVAIAGRTLTDGNIASVMAGAIDVHSGSRNGEDAFDSWNRARSAALVQANKSLKQSDWYKKMQHVGYLEIPRDKQAEPTNSARVVSARSSITGFVENGVSLKTGKEDWHELKSGVELADGDRVRSAPHARAAIHPYPDVDLFLDGNSDIKYSLDSDGNVSVSLSRGSVALQVLQTSDKHADKNTLKLSTSDSVYAIISSGYYRLNVFAAGESEMSVYSGSVIGPSGSVGAAKRIRTHGESRIVGSLDRDSRDSFDVWAAHRDGVDKFGATARRGWSRGGGVLEPAPSPDPFVPAQVPWKSPYGGDYATTYSLNRGSFRMLPGGNRSRFPRP